MSKNGIKKLTEDPRFGIFNNKEPIFKHINKNKFEINSKKYTGTYFYKNLEPKKIKYFFSKLYEEDKSGLNDFLNNLPQSEISNTVSSILASFIGHHPFKNPFAVKIYNHLEDKFPNDMTLKIIEKYDLKKNKNKKFERIYEFIGDNIYRKNKFVTKKLEDSLFLIGPKQIFSQGLGQYLLKN